VDTGFFRPPEEGFAKAPAIGFAGDMSYFPNQEAVAWFAKAVLPIVRQAIPGARFLIIGRNPTAKVEKLRQIPGVEVTGFVPDIRAQLARTQVSVTPFSIAAGIQNKILEAMAFGLPVVATSRAVQGLARSSAEVVEVADGAAEMAAAIVRLLCDPQLARSRGLEGRRRIARDYDWERSLERLRDLVEAPGLAGESACPTHVYPTNFLRNL
jgi:glycosyltransferase involved in cell wall biosynthesis